ncbi:hypothetical protein [Ferruginibacter sp.]
MKRMLYPFIVVYALLLSCNSGNDTKNQAGKDSLAPQPAAIDSPKPSAPVTAAKDTLTWIASFRDFRDALYQGDKEKVKTFINFPIMNEANEIWYLASNSEKDISQLPDKIKPFTEADFDKHYTKIFSKIFITVLLKVKAEELYTKGSFDTETVKDKNDTYRLYTEADKKEHTLTLNFSIHTRFKIDEENGKPVYETGESNVIYQFNIINNREIKFKQVRIAG